MTLWKKHGCQTESKAFEKSMIVRINNGRCLPEGKERNAKTRKD